MHQPAIDRGRPASCTRSPSCPGPGATHRRHHLERACGSGLQSHVDRAAPAGYLERSWTQAHPTRAEPGVLGQLASLRCHSPRTLGLTGLPALVRHRWTPRGSRCRHSASACAFESLETSAPRAAGSGMVVGRSGAVSPVCERHDRLHSKDRAWDFAHTGSIANSIRSGCGGTRPPPQRFGRTPEYPRRGTHSY